MRTLEVFFDYACPFCRQGHEHLKSLIGNFPDIRIEWRPCEAHPEPEPGPHSDLALQCAFYAEESGADMSAFHDLMYEAVLKARVNLRDIPALAEAAAKAVDPEGIRKALKSGRYARALLDMNDYAYEQSGVWAIPSYRMDGKKLDAREGVGVTKEQLKAFLGGGAGTD